MGHRDIELRVPSIHGFQEEAIKPQHVLEEGTSRPLVAPLGDLERTENRAVQPQTLPASLPLHKIKNDPCPAVGLIRRPPEISYPCACTSPVTKKRLPVVWHHSSAELGGIGPNHHLSTLFCTILAYGRSSDLAHAGLRWCWADDRRAASKFNENSSGFRCFSSVDRFWQWLLRSCAVNDPKAAFNFNFVMVPCEGASEGRHGRPGGW